MFFDHVPTRAYPDNVIQPNDEFFWFSDPNAAQKYDQKKIRYPSPFGNWRIGTLYVRDRRDYDDKISVTIHETFYPAPYVGQVFDWHLTEGLYKTITETNEPNADFQLPQ